MMLIHMQVSTATHIQVHHAMMRQLFQHMIQKSQPCMYIALSISIQIEPHINIRFTGGTFHLRFPFAGKDNLTHLVPCAVIAQHHPLGTQVASKHQVSLSIPYHPTRLQVIISLHILAEHTCTRLTCGEIVLWETTVDMYGIKVDTLTMQNVKHKLMGGQEV